MFAAFGTEKEEQELMAARAKKLTQGTCAHGNAGEASIFVQISHNKVKVGGYIALVLPLTFLSGATWEECRELIRQNYNHIVVATIASSKSGSFAFSADTDVGECLVVARKSGKPATRAHCVSLVAKPAAPFEGTEIARLIRQGIASGKVATQEGGPLGGTPIELGDVRIGEILSGPLYPRDQWPLFRIRDHTVAQVAHQLLGEKRLWLPGMAKKRVLPVKLCRLEELGEIGPYHLDIDGGAISGGGARGPFKIEDIPEGHVATYPILSRHDADRERTLEIAPDAQCVPRVGKTEEEIEVLERRRERIWTTRSRVHVNTDFRFNSQSLAFALTADPCLGGRAWPTFKMKDVTHDVVASLWGNSTFGLLSYWWAANKAQDGRGSITTTQIRKFAILDPRHLGAAKMKKAAAFFAAMRSKEFKPAHKMYEDEARTELDNFILKELLGVGAAFEEMSSMTTLVRKKLSLEPSFNGGK